MAKKKVSRSHQLSINYCRVETVIKELQTLPAHIRSGMLTVDPGDPRDGGYPEVYISYEEDETDAEEKKRLDSEQKALEYRRQQFETLKKEFEP